MRFYKVTIAGSFLPDGLGTRKLGDTGFEFLEVHSDDFIGDLTGDVKSADGSICLQNGADSTSSIFFGTAEAAKYS